MYKIAVGIALCLFTIGAAQAGTIRSRSGATAQVSPSATGAFQCLVDKLDATGYQIKFMGGFRRHGSVAASKHPHGLALDINQYARNIVRPALPAGTTAMAAGCGLFHGAIWRRADAGHFEVPRSGRLEVSARSRRAWARGQRLGIPGRRHR